MFSQPNSAAAYMSIAQRLNDIDDDSEAVCFPPSSELRYANDEQLGGGGSASARRREDLQEVYRAPMYDSQPGDPVLSTAPNSVVMY